MTRYLTTPRRPDGASAPDRLRLFCFPYAGSGASGYAGWQSHLDPGIQVMPVQLPGREGRMGEPRFTDLPSLIVDLDRELGPELESPYVLFGHSMGALIAFALAQRRLARGATLPKALILSAYRAPHLQAPQLASPDAPEGELIESLVRLGGIPQILLDHPDWLSALLPVARDDLLLCSGPGPEVCERLPLPLYAFAGLHDALVTPAEVEEWSRYASTHFSLRTLPGGHFYIREQEKRFFGELNQLLAPLVARTEAPALVGGSA